MNNSSDDDVRSSSSSSDSDDECTAYVRDDVAREYRRVFPDEQIE